MKAGMVLGERACRFKMLDDRLVVGTVLSSLGALGAYTEGQWALSPLPDSIPLKPLLQVFSLPFLPLSLGSAGRDTYFQVSTPH